MATETTLVSLPGLARHFNLPAPWLKAETEAGRLPHLRAGDRYLFDPALVEQVLLERVRARGPGDDE